MYSGLIHKYQNDLPVRSDAVVSLNEGNTPLLRCCRLAHELGLQSELYLKFEGLNPTGSFKDRGMTYAVSKAIEAGAKTIICASTGNTSASAAAYAARAGIEAVVIIPEGKIAFGKLSQAVRYGAKILQIRGNFDQALEAVIDLGKSHPVAVVNSVNPHRLTGQMTASFEIIEALGSAPEHHFLPVGNAGNISAYWMGYKSAQSRGQISALPKMRGVQAAGAAPLVLGQPVKNPETIATAIRIGNPASWKLAEAARDESGGKIESVTDQEILEAYRLVARTEGYFCEPASAASIAGLIQASKREQFQKGERIVCTLTGHGLKDPDTAMLDAPTPLVCDPDLKAIVKTLF